MHVVRFAGTADLLRRWRLGIDFLTWKWHIIGELSLKLCFLVLGSGEVLRFRRVHKVFFVLKVLLKDEGAIGISFWFLGELKGRVELLAGVEQLLGEGFGSGRCVFG